MNVAILGFDREGRASYEFLVNRGDTVTICDRNPDKEVPKGAEVVLGDNYLDNLGRFDLLVRTPGLKPSQILDKNPEVAAKITSGTNLFFENSPTSNIIGVTGTKGKGTTSTLIANMLEASGKRVHIGGNIGVPALSLLPNISERDWVILEMSSFQLIDIQYSPHIAVCLMLAPEHLDWHADLEEYLTAKEQIFARQLPGDVAVYYHNSAYSTRAANAGSAQKVPYYFPPGAIVENGEIKISEQVICHTDDLQLLGEHNWQNICAAVTAVWYAYKEPVGPAKPADIPAMRRALMEFTGLEHRLELVRQLHGIRYYNDSLGTTPETAIAAIQAFEAPKIMILGGYSKGARYDELATYVKDGNVRQVLLIGQEAEAIQAALDRAGFSDYQPGGDTMAGIVDKATVLAEPGDVVLLAPACASFGMFKDYKDRGDQFKQAVQALPATRSSDES